MKSDLKIKIEPARGFDYPIFVYDISKARTLLRFEPEWNVLNRITVRAYPEPRPPGLQDGKIPVERISDVILI
jgi:hypothetical protein